MGSRIEALSGLQGVLSTQKIAAHFRGDLLPTLCPIKKIKASEELPDLGRVTQSTWYGYSGCHQVVLFSIDFPFILLTTTIVLIHLSVMWY